MSAAASRSDVVGVEATQMLDGIRARGGVSIAFKRREGGITALAELHEWGGFRAKFPRTYGHTEAVLINTGGGLLGGDAVRFDAAVGAGAAAQITTQAAERVYRSLGPDCCIDITLDVASGATLHWLPQETILFNEARLKRTISVSLAADATLLMVEATVFGRAAMAETVNAGALHDTWRIWRGDRLIYADTIRLEGAIQSALQRSAIGAGAGAMATVLHVEPAASDRLEGARAALAGTTGRTTGRAAVSAWNGMLVARLLAPTAEVLKADLAALAGYLSGHPLPRVWGVL